MQKRQKLLYIIIWTLAAVLLSWSQASAAHAGGVRGDDPVFETEIRCLQIDGQTIYGEIYMPEGEGPFPLAIVGHGLGGSHRDVARYARDLHDLGIAVYVFDFRGGGKHVKSSGDTRNMSLFTEIEGSTGCGNHGIPASDRGGRCSYAFSCIRCQRLCSSDF